jgi:hypothetical protein
MRRLIDEEALKKSIEKWLNPDPNADRMVNIDDIAVSVMMEIEEQPTAYDVDKVVAELKKESKSSCGMYKARCPYIKSKTIFCEQCAMLRAIQIVKGGGIDGD